MAAQTNIAEFTFDPATGELSGPGGRVSLRPQSAKVLAILRREANELVPKDRLMQEVWPDTHVTDDSLVQCISDIRKALGSSNHAVVTTIPKKGYRLDLGGAESPQIPADKSAGQSNARRPKLVLVAIALVAIASFAAYWRAPPAPTTGPTTIAVLPFVNMSGDDAQVYFSNGVAEDLIVSLSNISDLRVLSRGTSFSIEQGDLDLREIAAYLSADYILEGSVRRIGDSLRVSASLVDGAAGTNVWANRFEGTPQDIFLFQDQVVDALVRTLSVRLSAAERERLGVRGTESIVAHDAYLLGRELENLYTKETNVKAQEALSAALVADPQFALAHAHLSQVYSFRVENHWSEDRDADIKAAFDHAERAVELDPGLPFAHFALGRLYTRSFAPNETRAIEAYKTAIRLDPNYDDAYVFLANIHIFNGRAEEALPLIAEAFERNPLPPYWYDLAQGMAAYFLGDFAAAEAHLVKARDRNPTAPYPYRFLIATYGQLDDLEEAEWMAMEYEALGRTATIEALLNTASIQDPKYRAAFAKGFRLADIAEK